MFFFHPLHSFDFFLHCYATIATFHYICGNFKLTTYETSKKPVIRFSA